MIRLWLLSGKDIEALWYPRENTEMKEQARSFNAERTDQPGADCEVLEYRPVRFDLGA